MAGYIGTQAVSVNTTSATISDDLAVGDDLTVTDDATIGGTLGVAGLVSPAAGITVVGSTTVDDILLTAVALPGTGNPSIALRNSDNVVYHQSGSADQIVFLDSGSDTMALFHDDSIQFNIDNSVALSIDGNRDVIVANGGNLYTATAGTSNFRAGVNAGDGILSGGNYNVCVGDEAGTLITTGDSNTIVGYQAGKSLAAGNDGNALIGRNAGGALSGAGGGCSYNVAIGYNALDADVEGSRAVAIGIGALGVQSFSSNNNNYNIAIGYATGARVETGSYNTLVGGEAGSYITTGNENTFLGYKAGIHSVSTTTGEDNTMIGAYSHGTNADHDAANVFGYNVAGEGGYTTLGNAGNDIRAVHGNITWATVSDRRYKKDIVDSTAGLSFINALQPRTFKYKTLGELPETFTAYVSPDDEEADSTAVFKNSQTNHGFIAQEVKAAIDADSSIKDGFRLWDDREDGSQEVAEAALIPMLTKAVQELSTALDAALARITTLEG